MIDTTPGSANPRVTLCSSVSEASGEDPAGSAWALRRIVLVELPLPWPYNVLEARHAPEGLTELLKEIWETDGPATGMIGFASDPAWSVEGMRRVIDLRQGDELASSYSRQEFLVPIDELTDHLSKLAFTPEHPDVTAREVETAPGTQDFFICTHGAIDACCATVGYPIYKLMRSMADSAETPTRVWRCTHFGGHRFAATVLEAPQGRYWAHLKAESLAGLMYHRAPMRSLRRHYRGWAGIPHSQWQIAEAEIFASVGWSWSRATITSISGDVSEESGGLLTIAFDHPDIGSAEIDVQLTPNGSVMTMDTSQSTEMREALQYAASIVGERPDDCLHGIGDAID